MLAIIGALANCSPNREAKLYGFGVWIFSNAIIGVWAACTGNWWLLGMYLVFMATSTRGFWSHRK